MIISSRSKNYALQFCDFSLKVINDDSYKVVFVDKHVYQIYNELFSDIDNIILIDSQEHNKSIDYSIKLIEKLISYNVNKTFLLYAIGGGIVQDLVGFIASVYYRGIKYILVPTTLLAMADSCIGSKTSINFFNYKNMLGTFYPPEEILIDSSFLNSLNRLDYISGLGEIFKLAIIGGCDYLYKFEADLKLILAEPINLEIINKHILTSLEIKKIYIEQDEFDYGVRNKLNFGHLHAHSIESSFDYKIPHGIAVILGVLASIKISYDKDLISDSLLNRILKITRLLLKDYSINSPVDKSKVLIAMKRDKKQTSIKIYDYCIQENLELIKTEFKLDEIEDSIVYLNDFLKSQV